jgi:hypothetical protein
MIWLRRAIEKTQVYQKKHYDRVMKEVKYNVGDLVYIISTGRARAPNYAQCGEVLAW